ncbi:hypothetical protein AUR64_11510 [Haloprofundus marisrubri]|uniref:DUF7513 domain-containing protein n=1 Tax=Haloprofundus marisrubri TaxID=1514971 RepID=A0A0W1R9Z1_9EURY|nr:hypothetical protein [Haloprofundus marisrubri]KTG10206.1 hypothetical protein AUR64_11510 [Haloprofundus marisrubri]
MSDRQSEQGTSANEKRNSGGVLGKLFAGWTFRTSTPSYDVGDELVAYVTGVDGAGPRVRVGDTVLRLTGVDDFSGVDGISSSGVDSPADLLDRKVRLRVDSFDKNSYEGTAELLAVLDESAAGL